MRDEVGRGFLFFFFVFFVVDGAPRSLHHLAVRPACVLVPLLAIRLRHSIGDQSMYA